MARDLTVVIHDFDGSAESGACARALAAVETPGTRKLAVVERSGADAARESLAPLGFEVVAVPNGSSPGRRKNAGCEASDGDVLLMSGAAEPAGDGWLDSLRGEAEAAGAGVAGLKVVGGTGEVVNAGYHVLQPDCELLGLGEGHKDVNQYYYAREVEGVGSTCMLVTRQAIEAACGFDADYSDGYDDVDFCLKVKAAGLPVICAGSTRVVLRAGADRAGDQVSRAAYRERWADHYRDRYDTRVMWHSWINAPSGYAVSSQYIVLALEALGVDVRYGYVYGVEEPPNADERIMEVRRKPKDLDVTQVVYGQGDVFFKNSGSYKVGYSMLEVTGIPPDWVAQANALDEVWVPSHFNQETFSSSGVTRPIHVMPLGVDVDHFHPFIERRGLGRFVFSSVFEWGDRKAPEALLTAYNREFSAADDVLLLLKVNNNDPAVNIERHIQAMGLAPDRAPVTIVLNQSVPSYQMGMFYRSSDCFVLPTRGEGWGMPTLEAMACGLPVISTAWSAQTEFFNDNVGYPIKVKGLVPATARGAYYEGFQWADPDVDHLAALMRQVYQNPTEARAKGLAASVAAREKWTWTAAAERIKKRLGEISSR